jgi:uncharacterized protein
VTNFGAFVDVGVHQDGLVHISSLTDKFVDNPADVVKAGDIVKVKVLDVDIPRKRISLTMRMDEQASAKSNNERSSGTQNKPQQRRSNKPKGGNNQSIGGSAMGNAFADAFAKAKK